METIKYKLTDETKVVDNVTLHRIECVTEFGDVKVGDCIAGTNKQSNNN